MESTINANINSADCIKAIENIGNTTYQNICNGTYSNVPWGSMDYTMGVMLVFVIIIFGTMFYKTIRQ